MLALKAVILSLLAIGVAACSNESATKPTTGAITAPKDSTPGSAYAGVTDISGRVFLRTITPAPGRPDSAVVTSLAGASIRLSRNDKIDGSGAYSYVTEVTTASDGSYQFKAMQAGYYLLWATAAQANWVGNQLSYVPANSASVMLDIQIVKN